MKFIPYHANYDYVNQEMTGFIVLGFRFEKSVRALLCVLEDSTQGYTYIGILWFPLMRFVET